MNVGRWQRFPTGLSLTTLSDSESLRVADVVLEKEYVDEVGKAVSSGLQIIRKDTSIGQALGSDFSWSKLMDTAADVYNGVGEVLSCNLCS